MFFLSHGELVGEMVLAKEVIQVRRLVAETPVLRRYVLSRSLGVQAGEVHQEKKCKEKLLLQKRVLWSDEGEVWGEDSWSDVQSRLSAGHLFGRSSGGEAWSPVGVHCDCRLAG